MTDGNHNVCLFRAGGPTPGLTGTAGQMPPHFLPSTACVVVYWRGGGCLAGTLVEATCYKVSRSNVL